jgi:hypothetical protein
VTDAGKATPYFEAQARRELLACPPAEREALVMKAETTAAGEAAGSWGMPLGPGWKELEAGERFNGFKLPSAQTGRWYAREES